MRATLLLSSLLATFYGSAGFMLPNVAVRRTGCRTQVATAVGVSSCVCRGPLATSTRACVSAAGLRMGEDVAADGGGNDGAVLAEARIVVNGQSTGGYFRAHARNEAHFNRKLCGALKELGEGRTEIIVEGKTSAIRSFVRWCKKGPGLSQRIADVTVDWADYTGIFDGFEVFPDEPSRSNGAGVP